MRLVEGSHPLKFAVNKAEDAVKAIGTVISRWQNQQPVRELFIGVVASMLWHFITAHVLSNVMWNMPEKVRGTICLVFLMKLACTIKPASRHHLMPVHPSQLT